MDSKTLIGEYRMSFVFMGRAVVTDWRVYEAREFLRTCKLLGESHSNFEVEWR